MSIIYNPDDDTILDVSDLIFSESSYGSHGGGFSIKRSIKIEFEVKRSNFLSSGLEKLYKKDIFVVNDKFEAKLSNAYVVSSSSVEGLGFIDDSTYIVLNCDNYILSSELGTFPELKRISRDKKLDILLN